MNKNHIFAVLVSMFLTVTAFCQQSSPVWTGYWNGTYFDEPCLVYITPEAQEWNSVGLPDFVYVAYCWYMENSAYIESPMVMSMDKDMNWLMGRAGCGQWEYNPRTQTVEGDGFSLHRDPNAINYIDMKLADYNASVKAARAEVAKKIAQNPWVLGRWSHYCEDCSFDLVIKPNGTAEIWSSMAPIAQNKEIRLFPADGTAIIVVPDYMGSCTINWYKKTISYSSDFSDEFEGTPMTQF